MTYPTLDQIKTWAGIAGAGDDTALGQIRTDAIAAVEKYCNRLFVAASVTVKFQVRFPWVTDNSLRLNLFRDLVSVSSITNGNADTIVAADYHLHEEVPYHQIRLRRGKSVYWQSDGEDTKISIAGSWGFSTACPDDIFVAIMRVASLTIRTRDEGPGVFVSRSGAIIDKSQWTPSIIDVLNNRRRK